MIYRMTQKELRAHLGEVEKAMLDGARFEATQAYRRLDATSRRMHSNTLMQQVAYHAMLVDQLQMRFPQHQPEDG